MKSSIQFLIFSLLLTGCFKKVSESKEGSPVEHTIFDTLLKKHVRAAGIVDYKGFEKDHSLLEQYLHQLQKKSTS